MNCLDIEFSHKRFGLGKCIQESESDFQVLFPSAQKTLRFSKEPKTFREFLCATDPAVQLQLLVESLGGYETLEYDGQLYCRKPGLPWKDLRLITVPDALQKELSLFQKQQQEEAARRAAEERRQKEIAALRELPAEDLLSRASALSKQINDTMSKGKGRPANLADAQEKALSIKAIPLYEIAFEKLLAQADLSPSDLEKLKQHLPSLCARYRNIDEPTWCITKLYEIYKERLPGILGHEFYTSLAAAYCDLTDIDGAIEFLELALHHNENRLSTQMENVLSRINYLRSEQLEGISSLDDLTLPPIELHVW